MSGIMTPELMETKVKELEEFVPTIRGVLKGVAAMCLDVGQDIKVNVNAKMESYTDGKSITVSLMEYFLDPKYNHEFWTLVMQASTAHECQHVNSSDLQATKNMAFEFADWFYDHHKIEKQIGKNLAFQMANILEDGRIESIIVKKMPGLLINFKLKNGEIRAHARISEKGKTPQEEFNIFMNEILSYAKCGGHIPGIELYHGERMEQEFMKIKSHIDSGVNAYSCQICLNECLTSLKLAAPYLEELLRADSDFMNMMEHLIMNIDFSGSCSETEYNTEEGNPLRVFSQNPSSEEENENFLSGQSGENGEGQEESEGESGEGEEGEQNKSDNAGAAQSESEDEEKSSKNGTSGKNGNEPASGSGKTDKQNNGSQSDESKEGKNSSQSEESDQKNDEDNSNSKNLQNGNENPNLHNKIKTKKDMSGDFSNIEMQARGYTEDELKQATEMIREDVNNWNGNELHVENVKTAKVRASKTVVKKSNYEEVILPPGTTVLPENLKVMANKLKAEMTKILKIKYHDRSNVRNGRIDNRNLWKVRCKQDNFFEQKNKRNKSSVAIYLLLDNSGSMSSANKCVAAREAAAVIEDAFSDMAACKIALFSSCRKITHHIVKEFGYKDRYNAAYNSLYSVSPCGGNKDGFSIRIATEELAHRTEKKRVLILLSDGLPSDYNSEQEARNDVRNAVAEARARKIDVIPIMFGDYDFMNQFVSEYQYMYQHDIITSSVDHIMKDLTDIFKKLIS